MPRRILPFVAAVALSLSLSACGSPEDAYTPVDELPQPITEGAPPAGPVTAPPPVDPTLPPNPSLPSDTTPMDPNMPPVDPTQVPPPSPEEPPSMTAVPDPPPTS
ncbi:MAG: hypothetical protein ACR2J7_06795 [Luteimonas sp.]